MERKTPRYEVEESEFCVFHLPKKGYLDDGHVFEDEVKDARGAANEAARKGIRFDNSRDFAIAVNSCVLGLHSSIETGRLWAFPICHSRDDEIKRGIISIGFEVHTGTEVIPGTFRDNGDEIIFLGWCDLKKISAASSE